MQQVQDMPLSCGCRVFLHGPFEVWKRDTTGTWRLIEREAWGKGRPARTIFKRLLATPGRRLSRVTLQDDIWPDGNFELADKYLYNAISVLHRVVGKELVKTWEAFYEMAGQDVVWTDIDACEQLLKTAENVGCTSIQALPLLEEALSYLERGELVEGESGAWIYSVQKKSEDLRKQCRSWLAEHYEAQGKLLQASLQYRAMLQPMPPDEEALQRWLEMLYRHGKTQEALKCYRDIQSIAEAQGFEISSAMEQFVASLKGQNIIRNPLTIISSQDLEEQNTGLSRRNFLYLLGTSGIEASLITLPSLKTSITRPALRLRDASIHELAMITAHLRKLHLQGDIPISHELFAHLSVIQKALNVTTDDGQQYDLWKILAQTQLLCRFCSKRDIVNVKIFNEAAIVSARNSGDIALTGATIGHLAHFYLRIERAPKKAFQLLNEAQTYTQGQRALTGWFALLSASLFAIEGNQRDCEKDIHTALEIAHNTQEIIDPYFTDFNVTSVKIFAGNSLLTVEQPQKASEWLTEANMESLSPNRHASAYYDIARAYVASNQLEIAQEYALKSIDCAVATDNLHIVPRFVRLANVMQQRYHNSSQALAIIEYALRVL